jgi:hypothetical protein
MIRCPAWCVVLETLSHRRPAALLKEAARSLRNRRAPAQQLGQHHASQFRRSGIVAARLRRDQTAVIDAT